MPFFSSFSFFHQQSHAKDRLDPENPDQKHRFLFPDHVPALLVADRLGQDPLPLPDTVKATSAK
jgi:hypothetical protein